MWFRSESNEQSGQGTPAAEVAVVTEQEPAQPNSYPAKADLTVEELAEYQKVCLAIGLDNSEALFNERMRHCCAINGFRQFNNSQVVKFLNSKLGKDKWQWLGLRSSDVEHLKDWSVTIDGQRIPFGKKQYGQKVPLPVLLTIQRVIEEVPGAHFYISGVPGVDDDPFLAVTCRNGSTFIIERWDEPDFRERQENM